MKRGFLSLMLATCGAFWFASAVSAAPGSPPLWTEFHFTQRSGIHVIGMIGNYAYVVSSDGVGQNCRFTPIGSAGGLDEHTRIQATASPDWMIIATTSGTHCGYSIQPLVTNGYTLWLGGGSSGDVLDTRTASSVVLVGEGGEDTILNQGSASWLYGTGQDDELWGGWVTSLRGEGGNDTLCAYEGTAVWLFDGGWGADTYCGASYNSPVSASQNCGACGL